MTKINTELEQQLQENSDKMFDLIIRTEGGITSYMAWLVENEIEVKRQYRLVPGAAIQCRGEQGVKLLEASWVISIEIDAPMKTR